MNPNTLSPYVRRAMHSQLRAPFKLGQRIIFDYEIIYLAEGRFLLTMDEKEYICEKGDVIFIRPGHPHTLSSIDDISIKQPHIHFDLRYDENSEKVYISFKDLPKFSKKEVSMIRNDEIDIGPILKISDINAFSNLLYEIIAETQQKNALYQLTCKEKMIALLKLVLSDNAVSFESDESVINLPAMIKHYIDYNFYNPITLETLEKQFSYSRFHICRTFLEYTGTSVMKYYNQKRIEHAKHLLECGVTVSQVATDMHFSSIYHFSRFFKKAVGVSPSEYTSFE